MNYRKVYEDLVRSRSLSRSVSGYYERHHIKPRCLGGADEKDNMVTLTAREHYIAHKLLCKMYPDNIKLRQSVMFLMGKHKDTGMVNITSRDYERSRLDFISKKKSESRGESTVEFSIALKVPKQISNKFRNFKFKRKDLLSLVTVNVLAASRTNCEVSVSKNNGGKSKSIKLDCGWKKVPRSTSIWDAVYFLESEGFVCVNVNSDYTTPVSKRKLSSVYASDKLIDMYNGLVSELSNEYSSTVGKDFKCRIDSTGEIYYAKPTLDCVS